MTRQAVLDNKDGQITQCFKLMGFVPLRVELLAHRDDFEYIGFSELFDDIPPGTIYPQYDINTTCDVDDAGVVTVTDVQAIRQE